MRTLPGLSSVLSSSRLSPFFLPRIMSSSLSMSTSTCSKPVEYFRKDYEPTRYLTSEIQLSFKLSDQLTEVVSKSKIIRNKHANNKTLRSNDLDLNGEELVLNYVKVNGNIVPSDYYKVDESILSISSQYLEPLFNSGSSTDKSEAAFVELETSVNIKPDLNLALSGLYKSGKMLCTQCEAMGFRRITFSQDRPDVLSKYTVRMEGDKLKYPLLLSNGNNVGSGVNDDGSHWVCI